MELLALHPQMLKSGRYCQMSGMILGSMLEADHRLREYEARIRIQKRMMRDRAVWESYEREFDQPPPSKPSKPQ